MSHLNSVEDNQLFGIHVSDRVHLVVLLFFESFQAHGFADKALVPFFGVTLDNRGFKVSIIIFIVKGLLGVFVEVQGQLFEQLQFIVLSGDFEVNVFDRGLSALPVFEGRSLRGFYSVWLRRPIV